VENALHPKIFSSPEFAAGNIESALAKGFEKMDNEVVEEANKQNAMHGCTGVVCLILDQQLFMANIGDSEAILVSVSNEEVSSQNMTTAHKATDPTEKNRIEALGGHVFFGRVFGALAVSRSFGDARYKKPKTSQNFVSFEPAIQTEKLTPSQRYLVLACDGLWDVMSHQEAANLCHDSFQAGNSAAAVAKVLVQAALGRRTEDNVTVIVVKIDWNTIVSATATTTTSCSTEENPATVAAPQPAPQPHEPHQPEVQPSNTPAQEQVAENVAAGSEKPVADSASS